MTRGKLNPPKLQNSHQHPKPEPKHWIDKATAIFVFMAMIATAFAAYFTGQQWITARDTEQRQLRAYVLFSEMGMETFGERRDSHLIWKIYPIMKNNGLTPAMSASVFTGMQNTVKTDAVPGHDFSKLSPKKSYIGAGEKLDGSHLDIPGDALNSTRDGLTELYIFAVVKYRDIFQYRRITQYCGLVYLPPLIDYDVGLTRELVSSAATCPEYNCMDDECANAKRYALPAVD